VAEGASDGLEAAGIDDRLRKACHPLAQRTLAELSSAERAELETVAAGEGIAALELRDWLSGGYEFDPECLTS